MPRQKIPRRICSIPKCSYFKPNGIPVAQLEVVVLADDEREAMCLVDQQGLQQIQAAEAMEVSRQTLANLLKSGRKKVTDALLNGKALKMK